MCSVRDVCGLLKTARAVSLVWDGNIHMFDPQDEIQMGAYGDYAVKEIELYDGKEVGVVVAFAPIKVS